MRNTMLKTAVSVAAIALAGAAWASTDQVRPMPPGGETVAQMAPQQQPASPGAGGSDSPGTPAAPGGAAAKPAVPPESIVGSNLVTPDGKKVGSIDKIEGDQVIVSIGGFLGIGSRNVALPWKDLAMAGTGKDAKIMTSLSEAELKELPEYKEPERARPSTRPASPTRGGM